MRRSLQWFLGATLVATALALWWPSEPQLADAAVEEESDVSQLVRAADADRPVAVPVSSRPESMRLDRAEFDPFVGVPTEAPVTTIARPVPPPPTPPVVRAPPQLGYRYLGQLTDPSGSTVAYLMHGDREVTVTTGTRLEDGAIVLSIDADGVTLRLELSDRLIVVPSDRSTGAATP